MEALSQAPLCSERIGKIHHMLNCIGKGRRGGAGARPAFRGRRPEATARTDGNVAAVVHTSPFFDKTYDEALSLLVEARNYFAYREQDDVRHLPPDARLLVITPWDKSTIGDIIPPGGSAAND